LHFVGCANAAPRPPREKSPSGRLKFVGKSWGSFANCELLYMYSRPNVLMSDCAALRLSGA
jgi:hypothetical protein